MGRVSKVALLFLTGCTLIIGTVMLCSSVKADRSDQKSGWKDYEKSSLNLRQVDWPGNYELLRSLYDTIAGIHSVRPNYRMCHFPLSIDGKKYDSIVEVDAWLDNEASQGANMNKLRRYNINIVDISIVPDSRIAEDVNYRKMSRSQASKLNAVREEFKKSGVFVAILIELYSLQSDKIEQFPSYMYFVKHEKKWKAAFVYDFGP